MIYSQLIYTAFRQMHYFIFVGKIVIETHRGDHLFNENDLMLVLDYHLVKWIP